VLPVRASSRLSAASCKHLQECEHIKTLEAVDSYSNCAMWVGRSAHLAGGFQATQDACSGRCSWMSRLHAAVL
jgi:hypothetical protein